MQQNLPAKADLKTIDSLFSSPAIRNQIQRAIPKHLTIDRLLRVSLTAIRNNPKLLDCTQQSLLACVMGCATLGLEPEPFLGQAYLVPFKKSWKDGNGKWQSQMECQLIPGYRGYISLARRSGEVQSISAQVVHENDQFKLQYGLNETLDHVPAEGERGEVKGAYVVFRYKDGSHSFDYMSKADIDKIRERSKTPDNGPWVTDYAEMAKKTVIRRHVKIAPLSVEVAKAAAMEDMAMGGESQISMFLPDQAPQVNYIASESEPSIEDLNRFSDLINSDGLDRVSVETFVQKSAGALGKTPEEVEALAVSDWASFKGQFTKWLATLDQPKPEPKQEPEPPATTNWWDKPEHWKFRKQETFDSFVRAGFGLPIDFDLEHPDAAGTLKAATDETRKAVKTKYMSMYSREKWIELLVEAGLLPPSAAKPKEEPGFTEEQPPSEEPPQWEPGMDG